MNERQRQRLLDRVRQRSKTIGVDLPDEMSIQGATVDVREFVFECKRLDAMTDEDRERIEEMKRALQRERLDRKAEIDEGDVSYEEGERLVESIKAIDRALNALEGIDRPSYSEQVRREKIESARRLRSMVDQLPD